MATREGSGHVPFGCRSPPLGADRYRWGVWWPPGQVARGRAARERRWEPSQRCLPALLIRRPDGGLALLDPARSAPPGRKAIKEDHGGWSFLSPCGAGSCGIGFTCSGPTPLVPEQDGACLAPRRRRRRSSPVASLLLALLLAPRPLGRSALPGLARGSGAGEQPGTAWQGGRQLAGSSVSAFACPRLPRGCPTPQPGSLPRALTAEKLGTLGLFGPARCPGKRRALARRAAAPSKLLVGSRSRGGAGIEGTRAVGAGTRPEARPRPRQRWAAGAATAEGCRCCHRGGWGYQAGQPTRFTARRARLLVRRKAALNNTLRERHAVPTRCLDPSLAGTPLIP
jgi:hypothetical protein